MLFAVKRLSERSEDWPTNNRSWIFCGEDSWVDVLIRMDVDVAVAAVGHIGDDGSLEAPLLTQDFGE